MPWKFPKESFISLSYQVYLDFFAEALEIFNTKNKNYNFLISFLLFPPIIRYSDREGQSWDTYLVKNINVII